MEYSGTHQTQSESVGNLLLVFTLITERRSPNRNVKLTFKQSLEAISDLNYNSTDNLNRLVNGNKNKSGSK